MSGSILYIVEDLPSCSKSPQDFVCSLGLCTALGNACVFRFVPIPSVH